MTCIKTGAVVYFENYDVSIRADVYKVGTSRVIRTGSGNITKEADFFKHGTNGKHAAATYTVTAAPSEEFWRPDIGVFVLPDHRVINHG